MKRRALTILNYAVNGLGMGHISRLAAISRQLRRVALLAGYHPEIVFITTSEADSFLRSHGFASFKIPSKTVVREQGLTPARWRFLSRQFIWSAFAMLAPDAVVIDTFPLGSFNELGNMLDGSFKRSFVCRAMRPEAAGSEFQRALGLYDAIIAVNEGNDMFPVPPELDEKTLQTEAILLFDRDELHSRENARELLGLPPDALVCYVTAGGGGDAEAEEIFGRVAEISRNFPEFTFVFGAGPLYRGREFRQHSIRWMYRANAQELFAAFDCAVSAGGFNSVHELLYSGVPSGFFPLMRRYDSQESRIVRVAERGACFDLRGDFHRLSDFLNSMSDSRIREELSGAARAAVPENHALAAAAAILEGLIPAERLERAVMLVIPEFFGKIRVAGIPEETFCAALRMVAERDSADSPQSAAHTACDYLLNVSRFVTPEMRAVKFLRIFAESNLQLTSAECAEMAFGRLAAACKTGTTPGDFIEHILTNGAIP